MTTNTVETYMVASDHYQPINPLDGTAVVKVLSGNTVYYADQPYVTATTNQGSLTVGQSHTFTTPAWLRSASLSSVSVTITGPVDDTTLDATAVATAEAASDPVGSATAAQAAAIAAAEAASVLRDGTGMPASVANASSAVAYPETDGAVGDGTTDDTAALKLWLARPGRLALTPGKTYLHRQRLQANTAGQVIDGNGATLKRAAQAVTTTTTTITSGVTNAITVAATSGGAGAGAWSLQPGDQIVVQQGAATNFDLAPRTILTVVGSVVTITGTFGISLSGTINVYHAYNQFYASAANQRVTNLALDGNSANWSWGRWQHTAGLYSDSGAANLQVDHCRVINQYGDAMVTAEAGSSFAFNDIENIKGRGIVLGGSIGNPSNFDTRLLYNRIVNTNLDVAVAGTDGTGAIDFSQGGPASLVHGNYIDGGVDGVGPVRAANNSEVTISDNEFWNLSSGWAITGDGSSTAQVRNVTVADNRCYGCGITVARVGNTGLSYNWKIHDNLIVMGQIKLWSVVDAQVHDNSVDCSSLTPHIATQIVASPVAGGGTFSAATYYWKVTAYTTQAITGTTNTTTAVTAITPALPVGNVYPVSGSGIPANTTLTVTGTGTTGTLSNAALSSVSNDPLTITGETTGSVEVSAAVALNGSAQLSWNVIPGATGYKVYRATSSGGENAASSLVATITSATTTSYVDSGTATTTGAVPAANTTQNTTLWLLSLGATGGAASGDFHHNLLVGGARGVDIGTGASNSKANNNTCRSQFLLGINSPVSGSTGVGITSNTITSDSGSGAGYVAINTTGTEDVSGNRIDISASVTANAFAIFVNSGSPVIDRNRIKGGGSWQCIQIGASATNAVMSNNYVDRLPTDGGTNTVRYGNVMTGAVSIAGSVTLAAGTATINVGAQGIRTGDTVLLTNITPGGTPGILSLGTITVGPPNTFVINSTSGTDTSTVSWRIIR